MRLSPYVGRNVGLSTGSLMIGLVGSGAPWSVSASAFVTFWRFLLKHHAPLSARPIGFMRVVGAPVSSKSKRPVCNAEQDRRIKALVAREKGKA